MSSSFQQWDNFNFCLSAHRTDTQNSVSSVLIRKFVSISNDIWKVPAASGKFKGDCRRGQFSVMIIFYIRRQWKREITPVYRQSLSSAHHSSLKHLFNCLVMFVFFFIKFHFLSSLLFARCQLPISFFHWNSIMKALFNEQKTWILKASRAVVKVVKVKNKTTEKCGKIQGLSPPESIRSLYFEYLGVFTISALDESESGTVGEIISITWKSNPKLARPQKAGYHFLFSNLRCFRSSFTWENN